MNCNPEDKSIEVDQVLRDEEPAHGAYEDTLEGQLQFHADRSLWFKAQSRAAKTELKRNYYQKKLEKNNKNLWKLLVRTPNAYNPLMQFLEAPAAPEGDTALVPFCQTADENGEFPALAEGVLTTTEGQV